MRFKSTRTYESSSGVDIFGPEDIWQSVRAPLRMKWLRNTSTIRKVNRSLMIVDFRSTILRTPRLIVEGCSVMAQPKNRFVEISLRPFRKSPLQGAAL